MKNPILIISLIINLGLGIYAITKHQESQKNQEQAIENEQKLLQCKEIAELARLRAVMESARVDSVAKEAFMMKEAAEYLRQQLSIQQKPK